MNEEKYKDYVLEAHQKWKNNKTDKNYNDFLIEIRKKTLNAINQQNIIPKNNIDDREDIIQNICEKIMGESMTKDTINGGYIYVAIHNISLKYNEEKKRLQIDPIINDFDMTNDDNTNDFDALKKTFDTSDPVFIKSLKDELLKDKITEKNADIFCKIFDDNFCTEKKYKEIAKIFKVTEDIIKGMFRSNSKYITAAKNVILKIASKNELEIHLTKNKKSDTSIKELK